MTKTKKTPLKVQGSDRVSKENPTGTKIGLMRRFLNWLAQGSEKSAAVHTSCRS